VRPKVASSVRPTTGTPEAETRDAECAQAASFFGRIVAGFASEIPLLEIAEVESLAQAFEEITECSVVSALGVPAAKIDCARLQLPAGASAASTS
jgi:hypothetical protein